MNSDSTCARDDDSARLYSTRHVPAHLLALASDTADVLGPEWEVTGLLSTAMLTHPLGFRVSLDAQADILRISAFVSTSSDPARLPEAISHTMPMTRRDGPSKGSAALADLIHTKVLPHYGRLDAIAALRLLSLPLRDAKIPATAQGGPDRAEIDLRAEDGGNPVITVVITFSHDDGVHVGLLVDRLTTDQAILCARPALPTQLPAGIDPALGFAPEVHTVLDAMPGLTAAFSQSGPRFTIIRTPTDDLKIRHDARAIEPDAPLGLAIPETSVATAYAVLRAYATK
ncbi:hypothetical protein [Streptomyces halobius]|uniref:Uncharacterized protein n=1 Tax=Streptomyces halobius TaxID=2879846 RepID=A0ABY4MB81_9ACTN|nr:hypothetical protein [Streptomyces halobius]UQA93670.1 hypothetical protein K9S39_19020 [Streptomyces halobius]